jgi:hypothetical protein
LSRMRRKKVIFITVGILLNVVLCVGLFINYQLNKLTREINMALTAFEAVSEEPGAQVDILEEGALEPGGDGYAPSPQVTGNGAAGAAPSDDTKSPQPGQKVEKAKSSQIVSGVQEKVNRPIQKEDLMKAGLIFVRRLSWDEITFLYNVGSKDQYSAEELQQARDILLTKLTPEELKEIRALGGKYGKNLLILDPNVPID